MFFSSFFLSLGPEREVISIYNNDFTTPQSRFPYFIEVYRCVKGNDKCSFNNSYPVPLKKETIEIVVPVTNNDLDPKNEWKPTFYKYVVYNHTACECVNSTDDRTPNGTIGRWNLLWFRNVFFNFIVILVMKGGAKLIIHGNNGQSSQSLSLVFNLNLCDFF